MFAMSEKHINEQLAEAYRQGCHANEIGAKISRLLSGLCGGLAVVSLPVIFDESYRPLGIAIGIAGTAGYLMYKRAAEEESRLAIEDMMMQTHYEMRAQED